jgi:hypothetical protein
MNTGIDISNIPNSLLIDLNHYFGIYPCYGWNTYNNIYSTKLIIPFETDQYNSSYTDYNNASSMIQNRNKRSKYRRVNEKQLQRDTTRFNKRRSRYSAREFYSRTQQPNTHPALNPRPFGDAQDIADQDLPSLNPCVKSFTPSKVEESTYTVAVDAPEIAHEVVAEAEPASSVDENIPLNCPSNDGQVLFFTNLSVYCPSL